VTSETPEIPAQEIAEAAILAIERDATAIIAPDRVPKNARRLRMATYNIHKGVSAMSRRNRIHELRAGLHALESDIVFLQEVQGRNDMHATRFGNWPEISQHTFLAGDRWAESAYGKNSVRTDGDHGNALLSRFRMVSHENIDISDHRFESRGLLHCVFDFDGTEVHCICAHLGLFEGSRVRQADAMIARIRSHVPADAPIIIAGDFNDWRHRLGSRLVDALGVREVFSGHETRRAALARRARNYIRRTLDPLASAPDATVSSGDGRKTRIARPARTFPSAFPLLRLDRVYVRGFRIAQASVLSGPTWAKLSDHAPIVAELVLE
jgi:endonuclease/exonuclease/phosphatase family metal-dependent hydrolase